MVKLLKKGMGNPVIRIQKILLIEFQPVEQRAQGTVVALADIRE
jgi:hypothetical protein